MIIGRLLNKIINVFTGLFAIAALVFMLVLYINHSIPILTYDAVKTVERFRNYCTLATVFCGGIEFTLKRNMIAAIVFAGIVVAVAIFMIYSDVAVI